MLRRLGVVQVSRGILTGARLGAVALAAAAVVAAGGCDRGDDDSTDAPESNDTGEGVGGAGGAGAEDGVGAGDGGTGPGGGDPPPGRFCPGVQAELGTGVREFQPVRDGDTVWLYRGPQGGYMIYLSVRARGLDAKAVRVDYRETFRASGERLGAGTWKVQLPTDLGDGWWERVGIWGQIDPSWWTRPSEVRGSDVTVEVTLTDRVGCQVRGLGWSVHIHPEPGT